MATMASGEATQWGPSGLPEMMLLRLDRNLSITSAYHPNPDVLAVPPDQLPGLPLADALRPGFADAITRVVLGAHSGTDSAEAGIQYSEDTLPSAAWEVSAYPLGEDETAVIVRDMKNLIAVRTYEEMYLGRLRDLALDSEELAQEERRLLAVEFHDRVIQPLAAAHLHLQSLMKRAQLDTDSSEETCQLVMTFIDGAIGESRAIAAELAPMVYYELGLHSALMALADERRATSGLHCLVSWAVPDDINVGDGARFFFYRAARELLTNVVKHSGVERCTLSVSGDERQLRMEVRDEGAGFEPSRFLMPAGTPGSGFGLFGIGEHVRRLGGELGLTTAPGTGTSVVLTVPIAG